MTRRRLSLLPALAGALALAALPLFAQSGAAGDGPFDDEEELGKPPFSVRDTNAARYALDGAKAALDAKEVTRGVREAQQVLDHFGDDLVRVADDPLQTRWLPAPEAARRLLEGASEDVRKAYEEYAVPQAGPELERAVARRDEAALSDLVARYGPSSAGVTAARLLAESAFEAGRPFDAAAAARVGLRFAPKDADLWLRRIDALEAAGDGEALRDLVLPAGLPATTETVAGPVRLADRLAEARKRVPPPPETPDWPTFSGEAERDRSFPFDLDLKALRWTAGDRIRQRHGDEPFPAGRDEMGTPFTYRWRLYEPLFPAMKDRVLYVADGVSVYAVDLLTGRRRWTFPSLDSPSPDAPAPSAPASTLDIVAANEGPLRGRTCLDVVFAPTVEGGLVYATVEVGYPYSPRQLNNIEISTYLPRRVLVALDAETGALRWRMGTGVLDRLRLREVSISSAPVVADGLVAAVGVRYADNKSFSASLLGFDARTGRLRWMREEIVVGQQELNLFGEPVKELFAGIPAAKDGTLYAGTGLGVLVAADLRTGEIRWVSTYDPIPVERVQLWYSTPLRYAYWGPSPVVVHGDSVLAAPPDAASLSCFDRSDGRLKWRVPADADRNGDRLDHFLGVSRDAKREVAITAGRSVRAFDLATGKAAWHADLSPDEAPVGRGALTRTAVYVPTNRGLSKFSIAGEGRYLEPAAWPEGAEPGNVLPFKDVLVVTGRGDYEAMSSRAPVQAFFAWEDIERSLMARRDKNPRDPALALEAADLWRVGGNRDRAEAGYGEAMRLATAAGAADLLERARTGLFLVHRERGDAALAEGRAAEAKAAYEAALERAAKPADRAEVRWRLDRALAARGLDAARVANLAALATEAGRLRTVLDPTEGPVSVRPAARFRLAEVHRAAGRATDAVDVLQKVLAEDGDERGEDSSRARAKREIDRAVAEAGRGAYRRHEEAAQALLLKALEKRDAPLFRRLLDEYPNASVVPDAIVGLADRQIEEKAANEAAATLRGLLAAWPEHALVPRALAGLARALAAAGSPVAARAALATLERRFPEATFSIEGTTWTSRKYAESLRSRLGAGTPPAKPTPLAPNARPVFTLDVDAPPGSQGAQAIPVARDASATTVPPLLVGTGSDLVAIDPKTATERWRRHVPNASHAALVGDVLVVSLEDLLVALDPGTGEERWRRDVPGRVVALDTGLGQVVALVREDGLQPRHRLLAVDAFTSDPIWRKDLATTDPLAPMVPLLVGDEGAVVARRRKGPTGAWGPALTIHSLLTGTALQEITCPTDGTMEPPYALAQDGRTLLVAGRAEEKARLEGWDLATGRRLFTRAIADLGPRITALLSHGDDVILLDAVGRLATFALSDGAPKSTTRIALNPEPLYRSTPIVTDRRITMLVHDRPQSCALLSVDRATGKAAWNVPMNLRVNGGALLASGDLFVVALAQQAPARIQGPLEYRVRLVSSEGKELQEMTSTGVAGYLPSPVLEDGTLVLAGVAGVCAWR